MSASAAIDRMVRRIVRRFRPERVILFGSQARGDAGPDSDVDPTYEVGAFLGSSHVAVRGLGGVGPAASAFTGPRAVPIHYKPRP